MIPIRENEYTREQIFQCLAGLTVLSIVTGSVLTVYGARYVNEVCMHPALVTFSLATILIVYGAILIGSCLVAWLVVVCVNPLNGLFVLFAVKLLECVWCFVVAVSLFGDSMDCRENDLWNVAMFSFTSLCLSCYCCGRVAQQSTK